MGESTQDGVGMRAYAEAAMALLARGASVNIEDAGACRHGGKSWLQTTIEYMLIIGHVFPKSQCNKNEISVAQRPTIFTRFVHCIFTLRFFRRAVTVVARVRARELRARVPALVGGRWQH